eukprot:scaffold2181_cov214-Alexandrium_tamarense.AAC.4
MLLDDGRRDGDSDQAFHDSSRGLFLLCNGVNERSEGGDVLTSSGGRHRHEIGPTGKIPFDTS